MHLRPRCGGWAVAAALCHRLPRRHLVGQRVERAKEMLAADPRRTVTAVALAVGFGSSAHFAKAFRKFAGTTPSAWQRQNAA